MTTTTGTTEAAQAAQDVITRAQIWAAISKTKTTYCHALSQQLRRLANARNHEATFAEVCTRHLAPPEIPRLATESVGPNFRRGQHWQRFTVADSSSRHPVANPRRPRSPYVGPGGDAGQAHVLIIERWF